jgi:quinol monooxygenase YgiN
MVTIIAEVKVKEGKMEEVKEVLKEMVSNIKESEAGTLEYIPHVIAGKKFENTILFYEKYESSEAMKLHMANLGKTSAKLAPLLEPGMEIKTCFELL